MFNKRPDAIVKACIYIPTTKKIKVMRNLMGCDRTGYLQIVTPGFQNAIPLVKITSADRTGVFCLVTAATIPHCF